MSGRKLVVFLLLAVCVSSEISWALVVVAAVGGSHHVSLRSLYGDLDLVLHHHAIPPGADGDVLEADDSSDGDHVIHAPGTGRLLTSSRLTHGMYVVSVCGWNVVIVASRHSGFARSGSTTHAIWSRPLPS